MLQYFRDDPSMIVVAANDGARTDPAWYLNLRAEPSATVEVAGRRRAVRAEPLARDEAAAWWERILARDPSYERYGRATSRAFPILRLTPTDPGPGRAVGSSGER